MAFAASQVIVTTTAAASRSADSLTFAFLARPQAMTVYCRFQELGLVLASDRRVWTIGPSTFTAPLLLLQADSAQGYRLYHAPITALSAVSSNVSAASVGQWVELAAQLYSDGAVQIHGSINGGAVSSGTKSSAKLLAQAWGAQVLRVASGGGVTEGLIALRDLTIVRGVFDLPTMRRKAGVTL